MQPRPGATVGSIRNKAEKISQPVGLAMTAASITLGTDMLTIARNRLLGQLLPEDFDVLSPHLADIALDQGAVLHAVGQPIKRVYFPLSGLTSLIAAVPE